jgi:hypothetical protein
MKGEMIWKIWKKSKLKSVKIWKIWKKGKLYSEMIWKIDTSSTSFSAATTALLLLLRLRRRRRCPPPSIHVYRLFFRIEKNHPEIVFFLLETMQVGIKFTI